jgi:O-antigen ligase
MVNIVHFVHSLQAYFERNRPALIKLMLIFGVSLMGIFVGQIGSMRTLLLVLALLVAIGVVLILVRYPPLGLVLLMASIIIPVNGPSNSNLTLALVAVLLGLLVLDFITGQYSYSDKFPAPMRPLLFLAFAAVLAFGMGQLPYFYFASHAPLAAQLGGLVLFIFSVATVLIAFFRVDEQVWLKWIVGLFIFIGSVAVVGWLFPAVGRVSGYFFNSGVTGSLFWTWLVTISFSQGFFNSELSPRWKTVVIAIFFATLFVIFKNFIAWTSGWMPALASIAVIMLVAKPRLAIPLFIIGFIVLLFLMQQTINDVIMVGDNSYSLSTRLEAWSILTNIMKKSPLFGVGPANYYWYTPLFSIRGYNVKFNSHSQYIDLLAQTGLLGFVAYLWFFVSAGFFAWRVRNHSNRDFNQAYIFGAMGGIVGTLVSGALGDWVIPFYYNVNLGGFRASMLTWLFLGGLFALGTKMTIPKRKDSSSS